MEFAVLLLTPLLGALLLAVWGARLDAQFMTVFARHIKHRQLLDV